MKMIIATIFLILLHQINTELTPVDEPPDCCFNGTKYGSGEVIHVIEESCLNLVCATNLSERPPVPKIINVQIPSTDCTGLPCQDCYDTNCVDESGVIRPLNSTWMPNACFHCECTTGQEIVCRGLPIACEPQPNPSCVKIPGPCCPKWDCEFDHCVDDQGVRRELGEEWGGPCIIHTCTTKGIATLIIDCVPLPLLNNSCELIFPEDKCCPEVRCGCVDDDGVHRELNEEWGGPCIFHICTIKGIATRIVDCPQIQFFNDSCELINIEGECCPVIRCGCIDDQGTVRKLNETWGSPCITNTCTESGVVTYVVDCFPIPTLNDSCYTFTPEGKCCPEIRCGCIDDQGTLRKLNETWGSPCKKNTCTESGVVTYVVDCVPIPTLNDSCFTFTPEGECCPEIRCGDSCQTSLTIVNGTIQHSLDCPTLGEAPHPNCEIYIPLGGCCPEWRCGIDCRLVRCGLTPRPGDHCSFYIPHLGCCFAWNCGDGCTDAEGHYRQLEEVWTVGPCKSLTCTPSGIVPVEIDCDLQPRPHDNCREVIPEGECCPQWNCSVDCSLVLCAGPPPNALCVAVHQENSCCPTYNCTYCFDGGKIYAVGEKWRREVCRDSECTISGIVKKEVECPLTNPPDPFCSLVPLEGECCPQWNCGLNCAAVLCQAPPHEDCIVHDPPPGECCATFSCPLDPSGSCVLGSVREQDCMIYNCTREGIKIQEVTCYISRPPFSNCTLVLPPGQCCVEWECSSGRRYPAESDVFIPLYP